MKKMHADDDATWARGRGWALSIGLIALPYYQHTNPVFAATAHQMIDEVLADRLEKVAYDQAMERFPIQ